MPVTRGNTSRPTLRALALLVLSLATLLGGCSAIPPGQSAVDKVAFEGNDVVSGSDLEDAIATAASPEFLFLFQGVVYDYELFDRFVLQRDLERIERYYRARGYYEAHARAARIEATAKDHVRVTIAVEEGVPVRVRGVHIGGLVGIASTSAIAAQDNAHAKLLIGKVFDEDDFENTQAAIKRALTDHGYAYAEVTKHADVDLPKHEATASFEVTAGPRAILGEVTIEGLGNIPEAPVRRALKLFRGDEYSTQAIDDAQQSVLDLGAFSSVSIVPDLPTPPPENAVVPLHVKCELTKLHQVTLGGGVEFDAIKTDVHLVGEYENHNFLGGLRDLRLRLSPGLVLFPLRATLPLSAPTNPLPEERFRAELRQPGFLEARTNGVIQQNVNTYPWIFTKDDAERVESGSPVLGYFEYLSKFGFDRTWWKFYGFPSYNFQTNTPFAYLGTRAANLSTVVISSLEFLATFDLRDSKTHPHRGLYITNDFQFAGLGGNARDIREQPDVRVYIGVSHKVTLALRASVGLLFPYNYHSPTPEEQNQHRDANGDPDAEIVTEQQLVFLRGFTSGGPSSNRGYPIRGISPYGPISFLNPTALQTQFQNNCRDPQSANYDFRCSLPLGGLTLWELNAELRVPVSGPLSVVGFCDSSDVSSGEATLDTSSWERLHLSCGPGLRYDTPVGPIRLDIGVRIPGLNPDFEHRDAQNHLDVQAVQGNPGTIGTLPMAIAFGIGEAF